MSKKPKEEIVLKGKHLTIKRTIEGKEVLIWDWKKLEKEISKAIKDYDKNKKNEFTS